jgi:hypothetical protein
LVVAPQPPSPNQDFIWGCEEEEEEEEEKVANLSKWTASAGPSVASRARFFFIIVHCFLVSNAPYYILSSNLVHRK